MANLVVNGSFERPIVTHTRRWDYFSRLSLKPWQTNAPVFELWKDPTVIGTRPPCYSAAGKQNLEILSRSPSSTTPLRQADVWQNVPTKPWHAYAFSFKHTPRPGHHSTLTVSINGITVGVFDEDGSAAGFTTFHWSLYVVKFIACKTTTRLNFNDRRSPVGQAGTHIDDVKLELIKLPRWLWFLPAY